MQIKRCKRTFLNLIMFVISGGGYYDEVGDETKFGQWVEISDGFFGSS